MSSSERRVAIVTGGGQGLGRAIARQLVEAGCIVVVFGRTKSKLDETIATMGADGVAIVVDLIDPDAVRKAFAEVEQRFGRLDILVNNAATYVPFALEEATDVQISSTLSGTLLAPVHCMREAIPLMRKGGGGDIVNISSESAKMPLPFLTLYGAAKAALEALVIGMRLELKGEPFRLILARVGRIADSSVGEHWSPALVERVMSNFDRIGLGTFLSNRAAPSEDLARPIVQALMAPRDLLIQEMEIRATDA